MGIEAMAALSLFQHDVMLAATMQGLAVLVLSVDRLDQSLPSSTPERTADHATQMHIYQRGNNDPAQLF